MNPWARPRRKRPACVTVYLRDATDVHLFERSLAITRVEADSLSSHCEDSSHITHPGNSLEYQNHFYTDGGKWVIVPPCNPGPFPHLTLQVDNAPPCVCAGSGLRRGVKKDPQSYTVHSRAEGLVGDLMPGPLGICGGFSVHTPYPGTILTTIIS